MRALERPLERQGRLDRAVEFLPDTATMRTRAQTRRYLTRPELSVLLARDDDAIRDRRRPGVNDRHGVVIRFRDEEPAAFAILISVANPGSAMRVTAAVTALSNGVDSRATTSSVIFASKPTAISDAAISQASCSVRVPGSHSSIQAAMRWR